VGADVSVDWEIALDLAQQRDQGGGLLVSQITPEHGVKGLRDRPKPVAVAPQSCSTKDSAYSPPS
jgi:hypothetical protein